MPKKTTSKSNAKKTTAKPAKKPAAKTAKKPAKAPKAIKEGYFVKVEYTGTFDDGEVFDSTEAQGGCPLEFQIGGQQVIEGFEKAIVTMKLGEEKNITLQPEDAYGAYQDDMKRAIPRDRMPAEQLEVGMTLMATLPHGMQVPVTITQITDKEVTIDMNHPLAGKVLHFRLKLVGIKEGELSDCTGTCGPGCSCG
ncbi:MAG: peptidylprolyl isomerase [Thermoplasmata archaeon]|nr:peptidylprolyl isomerase [Thermoplasmata archaeon]